MNENDSYSEKERENVYTMDQIIMMLEADAQETVWDILSEFKNTFLFMSFCGVITTLDFLHRRKKLIKKLEDIP